MWWWRPWSPHQPMPRTGRGRRWPNAPVCPSRPLAGSGGPSSSSPIAPTGSSSPTTPCSWTRSTTSSGSIWRAGVAHAPRPPGRRHSARRNNRRGTRRSRRSPRPSTHQPNQTGELAMITPTSGNDAAVAPRKTSATELRRVVFGSVVGTALEWYDFFIYGTAAALVFGKVFFPQAEPATGTLIAFATFGVGFLFRPLGGMLFGNLGDRIGRRTTLIVTTLVMGLATGAIGLLPTYESVGLWAPVLLVLMRVCQGLGAGAEFGGASTLLAEHAPHHRRGFYTSFAQTGVQIGLLTGTIVFLFVSQLPDEALFSWGWRVPFLVSFAMIGVALYVRLRVTESPIFKEMQATQTIRKLPVLDAIRSYPRNMLIGIGAHIADTALIYLC